MKITNTVVNIQLDRDFLLKDYLTIAKYSPNCEYRAKRFHAIIMRVRRKENCSSNNNTSATALIFKSGKIILTNCGENKQEINKTIQRLRRRINFGLKFSPTNNLPHIRKIRKYKIVNIVATTSLKTKINLNKMFCSKNLQGFKNINMVFDPSTFPGAIFKLDSKKRVLLFCSGKLVLTGFCSFEELKKNVDLFVNNISIEILNRKYN